MNGYVEKGAIWGTGVLICLGLLVAGILWDLIRGLQR
jgi:hypothetical protein